VRDPRVVALRDRTTASVDKAMHEDQTRVAMRLKNGKTIEKFVEHAIGSLERPMSDADLEAKFRGLVKGILSDSACERLIRLAWNIGQLADAAEVARASVPA
jgi:2-methylcitrate dehydratase PrpD